MEINELFRVNDKTIDYLGIKAGDYSSIKDPKCMAKENSFKRMSLSYQIGKALSYFIFEDEAVKTIGLTNNERLSLEVVYHGIKHILVLNTDDGYSVDVYYDGRSSSDLAKYESYTWVNAYMYLVKAYVSTERLRDKVKELAEIKSFYKMKDEFLSMADEIYFEIKKNPCSSLFFHSLSEFKEDYVFDYKDLIFNKTSETIEFGINKDKGGLDKLPNERKEYLISEKLEKELAKKKPKNKKTKSKSSSKTIFDVEEINITKDDWSDKEKAFISKNPGNLEVDQDKIDLLNAAIKNRMSVLLIEDTGTGKTTLIEKLSYELQLPLYEVVGSNDAESDLFIGKNTIRNGEVEFIPGQITKPLLNGGIALVDEFNALNPGINIALHSVLDDRRRLEIIDYGKPIEAHKDFFFFATMNEGDIYSGVNRLNQATKRRFDLVLRFDYLSEKKETEIIIEKAGGENDYNLAKKIVKVLNLCRNSKENHDLLNPADTGTGIKWYKFAQIVGAKKAAEVTLIETVADDEAEVELIREHIRTQFA